MQAVQLTRAVCCAAASRGGSKLRMPLPSATDAGLRGGGVRRGLCTKPPSPPSSSPANNASASSSSPASTRPTEEEVKLLAESAKLQEKMWNTFVPERSVRFGDQRFWVLVGIIAGLHTYNNYRDSLKPEEPDLPPDAVRRLPDGRLLMKDGSITAKGVDTSGREHTLHQTTAVGAGMINRLKDSV
jgi:hypothetical protein